MIWEKPIEKFFTPWFFSLIIPRTHKLLLFLEEATEKRTRNQILALILETSSTNKEGVDSRYDFPSFPFLLLCPFPGTVTQASVSVHPHRCMDSILLLMIITTMKTICIYWHLLFFSVLAKCFILLILLNYHIHAKH